MYASKRTGPVVTSVEIHPIKTMIVAFVLGAIGLEALMSLSLPAIIAGLLAIWWATGMARISWRQLHRWMSVYFS